MPKLPPPESRPPLDILVNTHATNFGRVGKHVLAFLRSQPDFGHARVTETLPSRRDTIEHMAGRVRPDSLLVVIGGDGTFVDAVEAACAADASPRIVHAGGGNKNLVAHMTHGAGGSPEGIVDVLRRGAPLTVHPLEFTVTTPATMRLESGTFVRRAVVAGGLGATGLGAHMLDATFRRLPGRGRFPLLNTAVYEPLAFAATIAAAVPKTIMVNGEPRKMVDISFVNGPDFGNMLDAVPVRFGNGDFYELSLRNRFPYSIGSYAVGLAMGRPGGVSRPANLSVYLELQSEAWAHYDAEPEKARYPAGTMVRIERAARGFRTLGRPLMAT